MKKCLPVLVFCLLILLRPSFGSANSGSAKSSARKSWLSWLFKQPESNSKNPIEIDAPRILASSRLPSFKQDPKLVPYHVSLKSKNDLEKLRPHTFQEAVKDLEGVHIFDQTGNAYDEVFALRGFVKGSESVFVVDGVRVNEVDGFTHLLPLLRMDNIDSIEIARGSSSAVYGSGAFGGVVNVKTKQASKKPFSFFGGADWSSFRGVHFYDGISGTVRDKKTPLGGAWTYYFNMGRDQSRGFRSNGEWRDTSIDFKTGYELPDEGGGVRFNLKNIQDAISNPGTLTLDEYRKDYSQSMNTKDGRKIENKILSIDANKKFMENRLDVSTQASIRRITNRFYTTSRTFTDFTDGFNPDTDLVTNRSHENSWIMQLAYHDEWDWIGSESVAGFEINRGYSHDTRQDAFGGQVVERTGYETRRSSESTSTGIFAKERITFFNQLTGEFGLRGSHHWLATIDELLHAQDFNRRWRDLSLSTGVSWHALDWFNPFFDYSQAFRVPSISDINPFGGALSSGLSPQTAETFEFGIRSNVKNRLKTKLSYFEVITHNEIAFDSLATSSTNQFGQNINLGRTRRNGIESRFDFQALKEFAIYGTYTLTRAIVRESGSDGTSPFPNRFLGQVPENKSTLGFDLQPLKRLGAPYENFRMILNAIFVGRQHIDSYESASQSFLDAAGEWIKPYQVWDLKLSYDLNGKEIFFKINNLFDERYYSRAVAAESFGTQITPAGRYLFVNPAPPREYVLGVRYEF